MKSLRLLQTGLAGSLALAAALVTPQMADAQTTNWVAYNDHRAGPAVPPHVSTPSSWGTALRAGRLDMGSPSDTSGQLINFLTGAELAVTATFTRTGAPDEFPTVARPIPSTTPMAQIFYGICDLANDGLVGVRAMPPNTAESYVTATFSGLDPTKRYIFRGSVSRNGGYGTRWSVATISAGGWTDAHINGAGGPGVLTVNSFPASALSQGQAAWNTGANPEGAVVGWNDIAPFPDGTFTIVTKQYTGAIPGGTANGPYGYSFGAIALTEVEIVAPTITANPAASTTVEQNRPFSLNVAATGAPLNYQWYKEGVGEIAGATLATYSVGQAQVVDSGMYYAVVYNSLARRTSAVAQVTVFADIAAPTVESIFSYPTVDAGGVATLDQIIIEFNEPVTPASVSSPASYTVPGGGNPVSVIVTNERSVVLMLGTPLAEDTDYSVTLGGATDAVGNVAGSGSSSFHSWISSAGNGLLMESYPVEDPAVTVDSLLADPDYPNNPDRSDTLRAFDTRLVYPDDTREGYGARIRGVFIPPVSGNWIFFLRTPVLAVVNLNPNGTDEAGKVEILRQSTQNAPYNWDRFSSSLQSLRAGRAYYIEGLYKAATGADYFKVAARLAGTGAPTPVDSPDTEVDANSLAGAAIAYPLAPRNLGGTMSIVRDLQDIATEDGHPVSLSVDVLNPSGLPVIYQWYRDGGAIPAATTPTYSFDAVLADNGSTFYAEITKIGSATLVTRTATLTVGPDITAPRVDSASVSFANLSEIKVVFSERVEAGGAQDTFNYAIDLDEGLSLVSATLGADARTATIVVDGPLTSGRTYDVTVTSVTDLAGIGMDTEHNTASFVAGGDAPDLIISQNGDRVTLSWPAPSTGFVLEETSALNPSPGNIVWNAVASSPTLIGGRNVVTLLLEPGQRIYRLRQPAPAL